MDTDDASRRVAGPGRLTGYICLIVSGRATYLAIMRVFTATLLADRPEHDLAERLPDGPRADRVTATVVSVRVRAEAQATSDGLRFDRALLGNLRTDLSGLRCALASLGRGLTWPDALAEVGARLAYQGDFKWLGIARANRTVDRYRVRPWRMSAADYARHVCAARRPGYRTSAALRACSRGAWDAELAAAMRFPGVAIQEESALGFILADLACGFGRVASTGTGWTMIWRLVWVVIEAGRPDGGPNYCGQNIAVAKAAKVRELRMQRMDAIG